MIAGFLCPLARISLLAAHTFPLFLLRLPAHGQHYSAGGSTTLSLLCNQGFG